MRHASMTRASTVRSVIAYQVRDLVRSRWLAAYTLFFLVASEGLLRYGGGASKALLSLGSIVLFVVPLVTAVFGTVYVSYTHLRAHETPEHLVCRLLLEKKNNVFIRLPCIVHLSNDPHIIPQATNS